MLAMAMVIMALCSVVSLAAAVPFVTAAPVASHLRSVDERCARRRNRTRGVTEMAKPIVVYATGVFDLFHVGHLNLLENARALGDKLIVGVSTDELVEQYKGRRPAVPFEERIRIVRALKCVDACIPQYDLDKYAAWQRLRFDIWVHGDDWYGVEKTMEYKAKLEANGVYVVFLPYTRGVSSSERRALIRAER